MQAQRLLLLLLLFVTVAPARAQVLYVSDVDTTGFPTMRAKFYAFDTSGRRIGNIGPGDVTVSEDGVQRTVTSVEYCDVVTKRPLSVGILVDAHYQIDLVRAGASRLIRFLDMPPSELGITTMVGSPMIVQDFTRKADKALAAVQRLEPAPGVDLKSMFYDPEAGGIPFITGREHKKVLVLITDLHCPQFNLDVNRLIADATREDISIFTIIIGTTDYNGIFKQIAQATDGGLFEKVANANEIGDIFQRIALRYMSEPCALTWMSDTLCGRTANVLLSIPKVPVGAAFSYMRPIGLNPSAGVWPATVFMPGMSPGAPREAEVKISAYDADLRVDAISSNNPAVAVIDYGGTPPPFVIPVGSSRSIRIRCQIPDTSRIAAQLSIATNACAPTKLLVYGIRSKRKGTPAERPTLHLLAPNGGEEFMVSSDTIIRWEGVDSTEAVSLEYSIDAGSTWKLITGSAVNLQYAWHVPNTPSNRCLARVAQNPWSREGDTMVAIPTRHNLYGPLHFQSWSPDGAYLLTYTDSTRFTAWDAATGASLFEIPGLGSTRGIAEVAWSPTGYQFATYTISTKPNHSIELWDLNQRARIATIPTYEFDMRWSPDGHYLAVAADDTNAAVWDAQTGKLQCRLKSDRSGLNLVQWSPDGAFMAGAGGTAIYVLDPVTGNIVSTLTATGLATQASLAWSPRGDKIVSATTEGYLHVWDLATLARVAKLTGHSAVVTRLGFSASGDYMASTSSVDRTIVWDVSDFHKVFEVVSAGDTLTASWSPTDDEIALGSGANGDIVVRRVPEGDTVHLLKGVGIAIHDLDWSPDGSRLAARYADGSTRIWLLPPQPLQQDTSDALWSIVAPHADLVVTDVDMKTMEVGKMRDSLLAGVICNNGRLPVHVLGVDVTSGDAGDFMIPLGAGDFTLAPGACRDMLFEFMPAATGLREARATVRTAIDTLRDAIRIHGIGVAPSLEVTTPTIDFGAVRVKDARDSAVAVVLRNVGTSAVTIGATSQLGPDTAQFIIVSGGGAFTLGPGESRPMDLRFQPTATGRSSGRIAFSYDGPGSPAVARLFGRGLAGQVDLPSDSAAPGSRIDLPLRISNTGARPPEASPQPFRAFIQVDQSLLAPVDRAIETDLSGGERTLMLEGTWNGISDTLGLFPLVALLGDTTSCAITLLSFEWIDAVGQPLDIETETRSGRFTLLGICREGGERLYDQHGIPAALKVTPNPARERTTIAYDLAEDGEVSIEVYDASGRALRGIVRGYRQAGAYRIGIGTHDLPAGAYQIVLRTPTQVVSAGMEVVR